MRFSFMRQSYIEIYPRKWNFPKLLFDNRTCTEEEMKERHRLVKMTTPCATPNWKVASLRKLNSKTSVASLAKKPIRRLWSDFEDSCHDTTPRQTTKRVTLRRQLFNTSMPVNFLKLATLVFENNFLNLASFNKGVTSGSNSFCRGLWSDVSPSSHPPWWNQIKRESWLSNCFSINQKLII